MAVRKQPVARDNEAQALLQRNRYLFLSLIKEEDLKLVKDKLMELIGEGGKNGMDAARIILQQSLMPIIGGMPEETGDVSKQQAQEIRGEVASMSPEEADNAEPPLQFRAAS